MRKRSKLPKPDLVGAEALAQDRLTAAQRAFAQAVGHALATTWAGELASRQPAETDSIPRRRSRRPRRRTKNS
jgi:hypothetical protein